MIPWLSRGARTVIELLLLQRIFWRHARHVAMYVLLLGLAAWFIEPLKPLDWALVDRLDSRGAQWPGGVEIIDLGWDINPATLPQFRARLAATMAALAALPEPPVTVVVDVALSTVDIGREALHDAAQALQRRHVNLIAVADLDPFAAAGSRAEGLDRQGFGQGWYAGAAAAGHAQFEFNGNSFWYRPCSVPPTLSAADCLPAVAYWVGARHRQPQSSVPRPAVDSRPVLFQPGHAELRDAHRWQLQGEALQARSPNTRATPALAHAVVIIGNVDHDIINGRSGPEVVAWAIASQIAASPSDAPRLLALTDPGWALAFALLFSALALALFLLLAHALQPLYQWLIVVTLGSAILTLGLFAGFVLGLRFLLLALLPQVTYVAVAVLITAGLCWHAARAALRERALTTDVSDPADSVQPSWEVFISYSHSPFENLEWVERELFRPLARALGEERVFFDRRSIRIGTAWYFELARAIECSRCVVAVYSNDYFRKNFCTFELGKAVVRDIALRGKGFCVLPLMRGQVPVPPAFSHLQFEGATTSQEMVAMVLDRLGLPGQTTQAPT